MSWWHPWPWSELNALRSENWSLKRKLKEAVSAIDHERMVSKVFHQANEKLLGDLYKAERERDTARGLMEQMHRRDPVTGRLLPRGK